MSNLKVHFNTGTDSAACGRSVKGPRYLAANPRQVTCNSCKYGSDAWSEAMVAWQTAEDEAFEAQEPRTVVPQFGRVNADGVMDCYNCGGTLFRERPRSLFNYHYVCANCGTSTMPMTETGMCT